MLMATQRAGMSRAGRRPGGLRPGEKVSEYQRLTVRLRLITFVRLSRNDELQIYFRRTF